MGVLKDRGLHADTATRVGGTQGALTGSIYSHVPVVLIEMCVLTNPRDEAFIASQSGQDRMAQGLADGVSAAITALVR
jgi:N-acetylmuramoyl-L-alanine amidase